MNQPTCKGNARSTRCIALLMLAIGSIVFHGTTASAQTQSETIELSRCFIEPQLDENAIIMTAIGNDWRSGTYNYRYVIRINQLIIRYNRYGDVVLREEVTRLQQMDEVFSTVYGESCYAGSLDSALRLCVPHFSRILFPRIEAGRSARASLACAENN